MEEGVEAADEGLFQEALEHFDEALAGDELTRDELVTLLARRSLVRFALRQETELDADLRLLLAIDPNADLGTLAPPPLTERIDALRSGTRVVSMRMQIEEMPGGVRVNAQPIGDADLPLEPRISVRTGDSPWQTIDGNELRYPASKGVSVEYYAVLIGPGGAQLVEEGSEDDPLTYVVTQQGMEGLAVDPGAFNAQGTGAARDDRDRRLWWWVGGGAAVVVVAVAVGVGLAAAGRKSASSDVEAPTVVFP